MLYCGAELCLAASTFGRGGYCTGPGGDRGGGGGGSGVYVRYGIAEQHGTGVGARVYLRVYEAGK